MQEARLELERQREEHVQALLAREEALAQERCAHSLSEESSVPLPLSLLWPFPPVADQSRATLDAEQARLRREAEIAEAETCGLTYNL